MKWCHWLTQGRRPWTAQQNIHQEKVKPRTHQNLSEAHVGTLSSGEKKKKKSGYKSGSRS